MDIAAKMLEDRPFITKYLQDSVDALAKQRSLVEKLLDEAGLKYSQQGYGSQTPTSWMSSDTIRSNAGLFMWLNLTEYLDQRPDDIDAWAAEARLATRLTKAGVLLSTGQRYQSTQPGNFRMIFSYDEATLREGIKR